MQKQNSTKPENEPELPSSLSEILNSDKEEVKRFASASREAQDEQELSPGSRAMIQAFESLSAEDS